MSAPLPSAAPLPVSAAPVPVSLPSTTPLSAPPPSLNTTLCDVLAAPVLIQQEPMLKIFRPTLKMRPIPDWKPLKQTKIKGTMFEKVEINEKDIRLDVDLLQRLWCKQTGKKQPLSDTSSTKRKHKEFITDIVSDERNVASRMRTVSLVLFKYNSMTFSKIINDIANVEDIQDMNYLEKILRILPTNEQLTQFKAHPNIIALADMKDADRQRTVRKFPYLERLWYHCIAIQNAYKRCRVQLLCLEVDEFCPFHLQNVELLRQMCAALRDDPKIIKIAELILCIGNFLNYRHKLGKARAFALYSESDTIHFGFQSSVIHHMKYSRSNQDQKYSLLLYLVDLVNEHYPQLSDWVQVFDTITSFDLCELQHRFDEMQHKLTSFRQQNVLDQKMTKVLDKADNDINGVYAEFRKANAKCEALLPYFCLTGNQSQNFAYLCNTLLAIKSDWNAAKQLIERAKNIFIALICGYTRETEKELKICIPPFIIWGVYVYFPRWNLNSIAKFLEHNIYQFNQYITVPNRLPVSQKAKMLGVQIKPSRRMKPLQWEKTHNVDNTLFDKIDMKHSDIYLDYPLLEALWCKDAPPITNISHRSIKKRVASINYNTFAVFVSEPFVTREINVRMLAITLFKHNASGLRDALLDIENIKDVEYVRKLQRVIPMDQEMETFKNISKIKALQNSENVSAVKKFPFVEQLWFHCIHIPHIWKRCELQVLLLEAQECFPVHDRNVRLLQKIYDTLYDNPQLLKIAELVLFIGNYFYFGYAKRGNAKGFQWHVINEFSKCIANEDEEYSLMMYLVEMIQTRYPSLVHWVNVFDVLEERRIKRVDGTVIMDWIHSFKSDASKFKHIAIDDNKEDEVMQRMMNCLDETEVRVKQLDDDLTKTMNACCTLVKYFGWKTSAVDDVAWLYIELLDIRKQWNLLKDKIQKPIEIYNSIVVAYCRGFSKMDNIETCVDEIEKYVEVIRTIYLYLPQSFKAYLINTFAYGQHMRKYKQ